MALRLTPIVLACVALALPATAAARHRKHVAHHEAVAALRQAEAVLSGHGVKTGLEPTLVLKDLAVGMRHLSGGQRERARRLLLRPTMGQAQPGEDAYTVPEHTPLCTAHFCIHWVSSTADKPPSADSDNDGIPNYIETMAQVFENVYQVENVEMGWRLPVSDGTRGGDNDKVDVYVKQLGDQGIFGYSTPDPGQKTNSQAAYLVMDNDFSQAEYPRYSDPLLPMEVTAAHEYNHVIQFGYDVLQDTWMLESTAVWAEDKVYDDVNDYVSYLGPWAQLTQVPLTQFDSADPSDPVNVKVYGDAVWNHWIEAHYGEQAVRGAWEQSLNTNPPSFAPAAYGAALADHGTSFFKAFTRFAADTAEWRSTSGPFDEGPSWPDVQRASSKRLTPGSGVVGHLDHTSYALLRVTPTHDSRIRLIGHLPHGTAGAFALVGREGSQTAGSVDVELRRVRKGGTGRVTLDDPGRFSRITAVLINASVKEDGYSQVLGDWDFTRDGQRATAIVSNDFTAPTVIRRRPAAGRRGVSRRARISVRFSEPVGGVSARTLTLIGPSGRKIRATVKYDAKRRRARLAPAHRLRRHRKYTVRLTRGIVDRGRNSVPVDERTWQFRTGA